MLARTNGRPAGCDTLMPSAIRGLYDAVVDAGAAHHAVSRSSDRRPVPFHAHLAIEQLRGRPPFEDMDPVTLRTVLPHLSYAVELRLRLDAAEAHARHAWQTLALLECAVFIVDGELHPVFANRQAERLVDEADGLSVRRGRLCASDAESDGPLQRAIATATARSGSPRKDAEAPPASIRLTIRRPSGRPVLLVEVLPLDSGGASRLPESPARAAVIVSTCEPGDVDAAAVAELFRLSPRQAALAAALAGGASLSQAAADLGITRETARSSLKQIFHKTGAHRQVDVVRLVLQAARRPTRSG
jgi:DNA-binding CsgD family transcriptional regulator